MVDRRDALRLLRQGLNDESAEFRDGQWDAIDALVNLRQRRLVVERTGWGKSVVYFISTRILRDQGSGPTLIVSPLLALMRNQIDAAHLLGIRAFTINSTNQASWPELERKVLHDEADVLLVSPERLANDEFVENVLIPVAGDIGLLVVDEAHCISDWGHDFRPDYRRLANVLQRMPPNLPILGTTATANNRVISDVSGQLGDCVIQRGPMMRDSLSLQTIQLPDQASRMAWLADHIEELPGTGIIYTLTRRDADKVANWLMECGVDAAAYYSDVKHDEFQNSDSYRQHLEQRLLDNDLKALVATTALGMGYDKPDLGFVVHYQAPGSIIAYYQQVGRAGRAIDYSVGILMSGSEDGDIQEYFRRTAFPDELQVQAILDALDNSDGMTVRDLESAVNLRNGQIEHVLKYLSVENPSPVISSERMWHRTPVPYRMDLERIQRLTGQREAEWREVQDYVDATGCLMEFLARALDDEAPVRCGKCACCLGKPIIEPSATSDTGIAAALFLRHSELPLQCRVQVAVGAFTEYQFGESPGGNLPAPLRAEVGRSLSRWGDAGWGQMVTADKTSGRFRDQLVEAVREMVTERWQPSPSPLWVTCVPSHNNPELVPDYAQRLASALGLPFHPVVTKANPNAPQKAQENRFHQCRNLDGVFAVAGNVPDGPVLLVDDVVDSRWTLTVISALLRQAGSGPVWPLALADSSVGG